MEAEGSKPKVLHKQATELVLTCTSTSSARHGERTTLDVTRHAADNVAKCQQCKEIHAVSDIESYIWLWSTTATHSSASLGAKCSAHLPSLKIPTPLQVNESRIIKEQGTNDRRGPAYTSRILWCNKWKTLSDIEFSICFNVLPCTRQETPPERGRGEVEYSNQLVLCFTDDHLSKKWAYTQQSAEQAGRARLQDCGKKSNAVFHSPLLLMCFRVDRTNQQQYRHQNKQRHKWLFFTFRYTGI